MTVEELIKILKKLPKDCVVITASDDEGNSFRKVPNGWCSVEKFNDSLEIINKEDYEEYDDLTDYVVIG